jgi:sugar (pentulose or hexulose) kinase
VAADLRRYSGAAIHSTADQQAGALGAAIMAGGRRSFRFTARGRETMVKLERTFEPDPSMQRRYDERFAKYQDCGQC